MNCNQRRAYFILTSCNQHLFYTYQTSSSSPLYYKSLDTSQIIIKYKNSCHCNQRRALDLFILISCTQRCCHTSQTSSSLSLLYYKLLYFFTASIFIERHRFRGMKNYITQLSLFSSNYYILYMGEIYGAYKA